MEEIKEFYGLQCKVITKVVTQIGYLQVLEYTLQDWNYLHVVQWHFNYDLIENSSIPNAYCETFYRDKDKALERAYDIGNKLLEQ